MRNTLLIRNLKAAAKTLVPTAMLDELRAYRSFGPAERPIYVKTRLRHSIGLAQHPSKHAQSFLFVCFGNIIRSPMCEALMNRALAGMAGFRGTITSAGLFAEPGRPAHPWAIASGRDFGISLESHRAKRLTAEMVDRADVIFAMDYQNQVQLLSIFGHAKDKVLLLGSYATASRKQREIRDPYYLSQQQTRNCYRVLAACIDNLVSELRQTAEIRTNTP